MIMARFLVIGRAGSGKTAVARELQRRGLVAFDADEVAQLSAWIDLATGKPTAVDPTSVVDYSKVDWLWDETVLAKVLADHNNGDVFLCGGAGNDLALGQKYFDVIFFLVVDPQTQRSRLLTRTDNTYGKNPRMIPKIITQQAELRTRAAAAGALEIDATQPITRVVDAIVERIR